MPKAPRKERPETDEQRKNREAWERRIEQQKLNRGPGDQIVWADL